MAARSTIEERLASVEARMSALDHLPAQVDRLESRMRDMRGELLARIDDARRETRVLHEDVLGRIGVIGEGFTTLSGRVTTLSEGLTALSGRVTTLSEGLTTLSGRVTTLSDGLTTLSDRVTTLSERADFQFTELTGLIEASQLETHGLIAEVLARFDGPRKKKGR